ncbi:hypothetical protein B0A54_08154 [Friedmanniomyces endolithicus]|uniref:Uncharacterized protein n=1 Tax=Friedmanniomyces endolithicus TaxID=329885 RepID=A0A4U0UZN1_9PEZI|nr:hypothetical protein LTS09_012731 [Friedmanniomyces endolithicus]TKA41728.1 hypothetical protein B0A54_08154 [Friedmanniomyces endolithicus]
MGDEYEYDDGFDDDDGFLYVEDEYGFVDELAETQIPDPGYSGTNYELERETMSWDWDDYPFWDELEYVDDEYWEVEGQPAGQQQQGAGTVGQKRKRAAGTVFNAGEKRRKVSALKGVVGRGELDGVVDPVVYKTHSERVVFPPPALVAGRGKVYALLPDWKTRFADEDGLVKTAGMPADMRKAAEAKEEDTPSKQVPPMVLLDEGDEVDEEEDQDALEEEGGMDGTAAPDPELLKAILKQRLGEAGLGDVDEEAFMASIGKLLAGEASDDSSISNLTELLLGKAAEDSAVTGFLSRQGISLGPTEAEDEEEEEEGEEEDSAISGLDTSPAGAGKSMQMPLHSAASNSPARGRASRSSGKKVSFDVEVKEEGHQQERLLTPPSSQDPAAENAKSIGAGAKRAKGAAIVSTPAKRYVVPVEANSTPGAQLEHELQDEVDGAGAVDPVPVSTPAVLQSRKRKVPPVTHDADADAAAGMESVRAKKEPATRRTRSARAG